MTNSDFKQALALRRAIDQAGGLVSQADLHRRWQISKARANELCGMRDFPEPVATIGRSAVYAADECDAWLARRRLGRVA